MSVIGDALLTVTQASRINYEILGNKEAALHAHLFPRYATEPDEHRQKPVWLYDWDMAPRFDLDRDRPLMQQIAKRLDQTRKIT